MAPYTALTADPLWTRDAHPRKTWPKGTAAPPAVSILQESPVPDDAYTVISARPPPPPEVKRKRKRRPPRSAPPEEKKAAPVRASPPAAPPAPPRVPRPRWFPQWPRPVSLLGAGDPSAAAGGEWSTTDTLACAVGIAILCGLLAFGVGSFARRRPKPGATVLEPRSTALETFTVRDDIRAMFDKALTK